MTLSKSTNAENEAVSSILDKEIDLIAETSWEVCNKIGGIYAVLSTKARRLKEQFGDKLVFVGPDVWIQNTPSPYFKEKKSILKLASSKLRLPWGITIRTGRWDIPGQPQVILINPGDTRRHLNEVYGMMWEQYGVDSLHAYGDYDESCEFAVAAAIVIKALAAHLRIEERKVVAHYDEWTTGMGLLYTQQTMPSAATIFTTHATSIGRSICGNGKNLYEYFSGYNGDQMAGELNIQSKHSLEKAAAHAADCFTTVSEVTARECEQLLDIRPQVVTPNGFEPDFVPKTVKYNKLRKEGRERLLSVASQLTGKSYDDATFLIATSGRHEYRNKGLDLFLDSIVRMEEKIAADAEALAFILVPGWGQTTDAVTQRIAGLESNGKLQKTRVIYVPSYLDGHDGLINTSYYNLLPAFDLTIFASYYEPWGYTPLESTAFGVPTVTTDKAGFGQWVLDTFRNGLRQSGVYVVERQDTNYHAACEAIAEAAAEYYADDSLHRSEARHAAFLTAEKADWLFFIKYYDEAFATALQRRSIRL